MSQQLNCVVEGCNASITEETRDEVLEAAEKHAAEAHPDLELDEETVETIKENIQEA